MTLKTKKIQITFELSASDLVTIVWRLISIYGYDWDVLHSRATINTQVRHALRNGGESNYSDQPEYYGRDAIEDRQREFNQAKQLVRKYWPVMKHEVDAVTLD